MAAQRSHRQRYASASRSRSSAERGDAGIELLGERIRVYELAGEGDSPRRATWWRQRALYEIEFDPAAAGKSGRRSRAIFNRVGSAQPQFKALLAYVDARISTDADAVRNAEDAVAVDKDFVRPRVTPWRVPLLASQ